ncbi:MAG: response regulator transcription factor [Bacteroidaceae bacterium]
MRILIVEDEQMLSDDIAKYLSTEYRCDCAYNINQAIGKIKNQTYDCILLDLMLPDDNGIEVLKCAKRHQPQAGVIIVSAKGSLNDKVEGLTLGADDYISKPFHLPELSVRIFALMRRKPSVETVLLRHRNLTIDTEAKTVEANNAQLPLTPSEYQLLLIFIKNRHRVLSKYALATHITGDTDFISDDFNFLYSHIKNLKAKLSKVGLGGCIKTLYGLGYKWDDTNS